MASTIIANYPELTTTWTPQVGDIVENFGEIARIVGFHEITGDLWLSQDHNKTRWLAVIEKCRPVL